MKKAEKPLFVKNLAAELKASSTVVLVDYTGLSVKMQQKLKAMLKEVGANLTVIKNTLLKLAGEKAGLDDQALTKAVLSGPTAIIITEEDAIAPLQILHKFAEEHDIPQMKVGLVKDKFYPKEALEKLSTLPSKEVLAGQAVGAIASPMYGIVTVLNSKMQELVTVLERASNKNSQ